MSEDKNKTEQGSEATKIKEPEIKDGKIIVDSDVFFSYKNDMHKYKEERNQLKEQLAGLEKKVNEFYERDKKLKEESLKEQQKYKELAELKEKEVIDLMTKFNQHKIESELKTKAIQLGINDPNDIKLVDMSKITINDNGDVECIDECLNNLKTIKPYLFQNNNNPKKVDTGKAGAIPDNINFKDLIANPAMAMKVKKEKPEIYEKLKENYFNKGG